MTTPTMPSTETAHVAHVITSEATSCGEPPRVVITTRTHGGGTGEVVAVLTIGHDADVYAALTRLRLVEGWIPTGEPIETSHGRWSADVKPEPVRTNYPLAHNTLTGERGEPVLVMEPSRFPFKPGERERDWHPATQIEMLAYAARWDHEGV